MNVLILTPDSVGSTLLQRCLTIQMQLHQFDRPVINIHELTNGLHSVPSERFGCSILNRAPTRSYHQSLPEIVRLLGCHDHYKISRLAQYHLRQRADSAPDCADFYQYLNDNFYIIACRRRNLLEHALGWAVTNITKKINFFTQEDKDAAFEDLYRTGVYVDQDALVDQLEAYRSYTQWVEQYFRVGSYFEYERDVGRIEEWILNTPVFAKCVDRVRWRDRWGVDFGLWNKLHYLGKSAGLLCGPKEESGGGALIDQYSTVRSDIDLWVRDGVMPTGVPIKKQTFAEKRRMIRNFDQCVNTYNLWGERNRDLCAPLNSSGLSIAMDREDGSWHDLNSGILRLGYYND